MSLYFNIYAIRHFVNFGLSYKNYPLNYITLENITKYYGEKCLFENLNLYINQGDKIGLIAKNGTGKTTLLQVLNGEEGVEGEQKKVEIHPDIRIGYLRQDPDLDPEETIMGEIFRSDNPKIQAVKNYEEALAKDVSSDAMQAALSAMEKNKAWDTEAEIKEILSKLKVDMLDRKINTLSGGQKKRVALAKILIDVPDLLILDEPTNHLDIEMIEWLENYLSDPNKTLFLITHDRYFIENVCDQIVELEGGELYSYSGSYSDYLEKKDERMRNMAIRHEKNKKLYKKELDWMRRQPKARTTKAKSRIDAFEDVREEVQKRDISEDMTISVKPDRLGSKILEFHNVGKTFGDAHVLNSFDYKFKKKERIGIVGPNGAGKSTFTKLMTGELSPDMGKVKIGETVKFGNYRQEGMTVRTDRKVIDEIREVADVIPMEKGKTMTAEQLLERFLFPRKQQDVYVSKLSGGEKRRLYLLKVLMQNPNFLILDEPTNDLDIVTLNVLEEYLQSFPGCLVVVSHDRFFMDKLVDHLFILQEDGRIRDFPGNYSQYRAKLEEEEKEQKQKQVKATAQVKAPTKKEVADTLNYEDRKQLRRLEQKIEKLTKEKEELGARFSEPDLNVEDMAEISRKIKAIDTSIEETEMEWLELAEKA